MPTIRPTTTPHKERAPAVRRLRTETDAALLQRTRDGSDAAFAELYRRHQLDAHRYARHLTYRHLHHDAADDVVAEAVRKMLSALRHGRGPTVGFRQYLFASIRSVTLRQQRPPRLESAEMLADSIIPAADEYVDALVAKTAFNTLPLRWRQVLWATEVSGLTPSEIAPLVGLRPNAIAALAVRARDALRIAYTMLHLPPAPRASCDRPRQMIARQAVLKLTPPQTANLDRHLTTCVHCRRAAAAIDNRRGPLASRQGGTPIQQPRRDASGSV